MSERVIFTGLKVDTMPAVPVPLVVGGGRVGDRRRAGELLSVPDVVRELRCTIWKVKVRLKRGLLPERVKVGGRLYWRREQLDDLRAALGRRVYLRTAPVKPRKRKLTPDDMRELLSLRLCGLTLDVLAKLFGVSRSRIAQLLQELQRQAKPGQAEL